MSKEDVLRQFQSKDVADGPHAFAGKQKRLFSGRCDARQKRGTPCCQPLRRSTVLS